MNCPRSSPNYRQYRYRGRQRGAALVVAMLVFALSTALVVAMKSEFTRFYLYHSVNNFVEEGVYLSQTKKLKS